MIKLTGDRVEFCKSHYKDETIWIDNLSQEYLQYYLRKHNCLAMAGLPKGKEYCEDYYTHEDSWGKDDLFQCFTKYNIDFAKEFCDDRFSKDKFLLMQCYATKNVQRG